jgi:purine nucleosidase
MRPQEEDKTPAAILIDTALGNSIDEALALALLYGFEGKTEVRVVALSVSKPNLKAAAFCEAIGRFYAGAASGAFGAIGRTVPVGLADAGPMPEDSPMLTVPLARRNEDGKPLYNHGIEKLSDTAEVRAMLRNALTAQVDQNCVIVLTGPANNLVRLLDLPGVKDLISRKVKYLSVVAGSYVDGSSPINTKTDLPAAKKLFVEWPTPIVATGYEIGTSLLFPASSIEKDFAWSTAHPIVDAYRAFKPMPYDAPTWAMAAVLQAVRPLEGFFKLSQPGTISLLDDGRTKFTPSADGKHRYLILDPAQKEKILKIYTEIASAKPVPRAQRFRRPQQQQQVEPPKPPPAPVKPPSSNQ